MKYGKCIDEFKTKIKTQYKSNDCSRPKNNTKTIQIRVDEKANGNGVVSLYYDEEFFRRFGRHNTVWVEVFVGDLKKACEVARELKTEIELPIKFNKYKKIELV
jgi:hypothetical protein